MTAIRERAPSYCCWLALTGSVCAEIPIQEWNRAARMERIHTALEGMRGMPAIAFLVEWRCNAPKGQGKQISGRLTGTCTRELLFADDGSRQWLVSSKATMVGTDGSWRPATRPQEKMAPSSPFALLVALDDVFFEARQVREAEPGSALRFCFTYAAIDLARDREAAAQEARATLPHCSVPNQDARDALDLLLKLAANDRDVARQRLPVVATTLTLRKDPARIEAVELDVDRPAGAHADKEPPVRIQVDIRFEQAAGKLPEVDEKTARALGLPASPAAGK